VKPKAEIKKLLKDSLEAAEKCQICATCKHSYFRPESYDGYCKYIESHRDFTFLHLKCIDKDDFCEHWEKKPPPKKA